jgi:hypothetical protein
METKSPKYRFIEKWEPQLKRFSNKKEFKNDLSDLLLDTFEFAWEECERAMNEPVSGYTLNSEGFRVLNKKS